jgi:hypothetical protein
MYNNDQLKVQTAFNSYDAYNNVATEIEIHQVTSCFFFVPLIALYQRSLPFTDIQAMLGDVPLKYFNCDS